MRALWLCRLPRFMMIFALLPYLGLCALIFIQQQSLLYPADPDAVAAAGWQAFPHRDEALAYLHSPQQPARGTVVVFHGNGGTAADRKHFADALNALGYRVLLAEYPGYGGRPGKPSEANLVADARRLLQLAAEHYREPIFVWGESLGAGVAAAAVADGNPRVRGVALLTPWNTLADAAGTHYPYLPVRWLLKDRYDSAANLKSFPGRVAIIVAGADRTIPAVLGEKLYAEHLGKKRLWRFPEADHNTWPADVDQPWWGEVMRHLDSENGDATR